MSQKAWMNAYTKGSKSLQDRLAKVHRNNPEFQDFVKKHGFGGNLSVKQSGLQKKPSVATVKPTDAPNPERGNLDREALIKAAAEKIKNRRMANANRVAFGGELGGGFSMPGGGFRRYSESIDETVAANFRKIVPGLGKLQAKNRAMDLDKELDQGIIAKKFTRKERMRRAKHIERFARVASGENAFRKEDISYKDGQISMYKGGWVAKRDGKRIGTNVPSKEHAKSLIDNTYKSLTRKTMDVVKKKAREVMSGFGKHSLATESAANRRRIRSWDSAVLKDRSNDPPFTPDKPHKNLGIVVGKNDPGYSKARHLARLGLKKAVERDRINKTIDYISNPKYSVLDKNKINSLLKGK